MALAGVAHAKRPPPPREAPPAPAKKIDIRLVKHGAVARITTEAGVLEVRTTVDDVLHRRALAPAEQAELLAAARAAERADDVRRSCGTEDEPFVELTIDGKTTATAVCSTGRIAGDYFAPWRALVALVQRLAAGPPR